MEFRTEAKIIRLEDITSKINAEPNKRGRREDDGKNISGYNEAVYTSTGTKLLKHLDRLQDAQNGIWRPVNLQIAPTDKCNLECNFCSVWKRDGDTIPIDRLKRTIDDFMEVGPLKSAEVTGGGDPTLYKDLPELINYLSAQNIDTGLITNGLLLKKYPDSLLEKLKWLRISLSFLDAENYYGENSKVMKDIQIPDIDVDLGLSYVWTPSSNLEKLHRIAEIAERTNPNFVRIVPNCQSPEEQRKYKEEVSPLLEQFPNFFFQTKEYSVHFACRVGYLKPFLNADGNLYHCSASPLYTGRFSEEWKIEVWMM